MFNTRKRTLRRVMECLIVRRSVGFSTATDIEWATGLRPWSLYPALAILEERGEIRSDWQPGLPRRRVYWVVESALGPEVGTKGGDAVP